MISLFEYFKLITFYPRKKLFLDEGVGIEARYARCKSFWEKHLLYSKSFIEETLKESKYQKIAILGAGTLLDVNLESLCELAKEVHLFDANPRAASFWPRKINSTHIIPHIEDVTGCFNSLRKKKSRFQDKLTTPNLGAFDVVISLNILSQLSVMLSGLLHKECSQEELLSLSRELELIHVESLKNAAQEKIIIIFDKNFYFYTQDVADWDVESSLQIDVQQSLSPWALSATSQWLWHVAPQGIEHPEYGVIHDVRAMSLSKA